MRRRESWAGLPKEEAQRRGAARGFFGFRLGEPVMRRETHHADVLALLCLSSNAVNFIDLKLVAAPVLPRSSLDTAKTFGGTVTVEKPGLLPGFFLASGPSWSAL